MNTRRTAGNHRRPRFRPTSMHRVRTAILAVVCLSTLGVILAACGGRGGAGGSPSPSAPPIDPVELKLMVIDHVGPDFPYCDPDSFPVGHGTPLGNARAAQARMKADPAYPTILSFLSIDPGAELTNRQLLTVYDRYKRLRFVEVGATPEGYRFEVHQQDDVLSGTVTPLGEIRVTGRTTLVGGCPICLARNTRIATPNGFVRVQDVQVGMAVWSTDRAGHRIRATVAAVGRTPVPPTHEVVRLVLADGRTVLVSPGHPTPDGAAVGELRVGMAFEDSTVVSARRIPYAGGFTYDVLPSGPTGTYFADGILLGSTLFRGAAGHR
ncbi:MAG TPA: Hint domain-containing protein [Actinomycetota bacterium]|nr:Hint domain-containing protein [Actinomycetota bacterium]